MTFQDLAGNPRRGKIGFLSMLSVGLGYSLVAHFLDLLHAPPVPPPFLAIPADRYFHWAAWFYAPGMLLGWILASAVIQIFSRLLGGQGKFEDTLALTGWASALGTLATLLPDLVLTLVQVAGWMDYGHWRGSVDHGGPWFYIVWAYLLLYLGLFLVFYPQVVWTVHRLSGRRAVGAGWTGFLVYQGFLMLFAR
ncbi:MAG TPA: YIP1 family protein [bacterium]|nr:YIP1 family protein [bacterium]